MLKQPPTSRDFKFGRDGRREGRKDDVSLRQFFKLSLETLGMLVKTSFVSRLVVRLKQPLRSSWVRWRPRGEEEKDVKARVERRDMLWREREEVAEEGEGWGEEDGERHRELLRFLLLLLLLLFLPLLLSLPLLPPSLPPADTRIPSATASQNLLSNLSSWREPELVDDER